MSLRRWARCRGMALPVLAAIVASLAPVAAAPALAAGNIILVTTAVDAEFPADGGCSLRAAILASNVGGLAGYCSPGSAGQDSIRFGVGGGVPVIRVLSNLPAISQPVTIRGDTGGATRVRLDGAGAAAGPMFDGLQFGALADGSLVRRLVITGFRNGISTDGDITIAGNVIGPNSEAGVASYGTTIIGGVNTGTPDPCSGDCNVISGNGTVGVFASGHTTIKGNFIGTAAAGNGAAGNGDGVWLGSGSALMLGGTTPGERNVISGNLGIGVSVSECSDCVIQGNYIGTDRRGLMAVPNGEQGITVGHASDVTIGGASAGSGNVISGNGESGIVLLHGSEDVVIQGNAIGTDVAGSPLGNAGSGIGVITPGETVTIGSVLSAAVSNTIAYNGRPGVSVSDGAVEVRRNSIHHNGVAGIEVVPQASGQTKPPVITGVSPTSGTACVRCAVDVYSDSADEGATFEGTAMADASGAWVYAGPVGGPNVTATATHDGHTSPFSAAVAVAAPYRPDARIRKGGGKLAGNNVYNPTGVGQARTAEGRRGARGVAFWLSIQNDRKGTDRFAVRATGGSAPKYVVRYFRGTTEITSKIAAGTYRTSSLGKGATFKIKVTVKVKKGAASGSKVARLVTVTSVGDPTRSDAVRFTTRRR